jgi:hypothetical protein
MASASWWIRRTGSLLHIVACALLPWSPSAIFAQTADILERMDLVSEATLEREIMVPMRDGVRLSTADSANECARTHARRSDSDTIR